MHAGPAAGLTIRPAVEADGERLVEIDRLTWSPTFTPRPGPPEAGDVFWNERSTPENVLVAELAGQIVGYVKIQHPTPFPASEHVWYCSGLAVEPGSQRMGVGRALMEAVIEEARSRGGRRLTLGVFAPNEAARALYEELGFVVEGIQRAEFRIGEDQYVDDYMLALDLDQAAKRR